MLKVGNEGQIGYVVYWLQDVHVGMSEARSLSD